MVTVKSGWKTYTKPANASAWWLKQAKASNPVVKPATTSPTSPTVKNFTGGDPGLMFPTGTTQQVKPTIAPTLSNFGDTNKQGTKYTWPWYATATMATGKDFTKVAQIAAPGQSFDRFGKSAEQMNMKTPGFIDQRNDAYITELARANPTFNQLDEATQKKQIKDLLIQRDVNKELYSGGNGEADVLNTINSIYNRIGQGKSQQEVQTELATKLYDKEIQKIDAQYQSEKNNFLKAGAVEDRFTNFNEVNDKINKTLIAAGQHRQDNLYTGTPTDQQIQEIANGLWQDFATTKKILENRGFEMLELQPDFQDEASQSFNRWLTDLEISRNRALEDATNQSLKTQTAIKEQIDDVKLTMERQVGMGEKAGALSGALRSSGYMAWLDAIKNDALKNVDRLQTRADRDTQDTATYKKRINETYELNASRTKEDLDKALNQIKSQLGTEMSQYLNQYAPSSVELGSQLDAITDKYGIMSQNALNTYMTNLRGITDTMTYDTEKVMSLQKMKQDIQQTNVNNMLANNGMALSGITYTDLNNMLSAGDISPTDYSSMAGYMKSLGISQLQKMWVPTAEDISLYNTLLEKNVSPQQAIATITAKNPSRYSQAGAWSDWKLDIKTWNYYRTGANGQLEFNNAPGSTSSQGLQFTDNTKNMLYYDEQTQKADLVEYGKKNAWLVYEFGWDGSKSVDCSQLLVSRWKEAGVLPQGTDMNAQSIYNKANRAIPLENLKAGDLIFYNDWSWIKHTGIAMGGKQADWSLRILDASTTMWGVSERTIKLDANNRLLNDKKFTVLGTDNWMTPGKTKQWEAPAVSTTTSDTTMSSIWVPVAYERRIKNMVPATLMNSEIELEQLNGIIKSLYQSGTSAEDAVLTYLWVDIPKKEDKKFAAGLISTAKWLTAVQPNFYSNLSDFINKWDRENAVLYMEREAVRQAQKDNPDLKFSDAWTSFAVKQGQDIKTLMDQYTNQFWPIQGKWNDLTKWWFGNKEAQKLATKITQAIAKVRNDLVGSQITSNEKALIQELIPSLDETADTAYIKVQNLIDTPLSQYNQARSYVGLPELTNDTLLNRKNRVNLYNSIQDTWTPASSTSSNPTQYQSRI